MLKLLITGSLLGCVVCKEFSKRGIPVMTNSIPEDPTGSTTLSSRNNQFPFLAVQEYRPKRKQMKKRKLLRRLGDDFDPNWMSIDSPSNNVLPDFKQELPKQLISDFEKLQYEMGRASKLAIMNNETLHVIQVWLLEKASCQVQHHWEDLGGLFWPRYVKTGTCVSKGSCSWPSGMRCVVNENKTIKVLRWHCKLRRRKPHRVNNKSRSKRLSVQKATVFRRLTCKWIKIPYYVTDGCFCSC